MWTVVHGGWVPGVVGTGDGAIPSATPWYGSGAVSHHCTALFPHCGLTVSPLWPLWDLLWPVCDLFWPVWDLILPHFGLFLGWFWPKFTKNGPLFGEFSRIFMKKWKFTHFRCVSSGADRSCSNPYPNPEAFVKVSQKVSKNHCFS